ncbi:MAG: hypothetical protein AVDCRST_MAG77-1476, partial [uncultured Chloroflexi bacterium]
AGRRHARGTLASGGVRVAVRRVPRGPAGVSGGAGARREPPPAASPTGAAGGAVAPARGVAARRRARHVRFSPGGVVL